MSTHDDKGRVADPYHVPPDNLWANAWRVAAVLGGIGILGAVVGWSSDPHRFAFAWLFAFMAMLTLGLGAIFFVIVQHLTSSAWSVTVRRTAELLAAGVPVFALLFIPVAANIGQLYEWARFEEQHTHAEPAPFAGADEHASSQALLGASVARAQEPVPGGEEHRGELGAPTEQHAGAEPAARRTPEEAEHEELLEHKSPWLRAGGVFGWYARALLYFLVWIALALFYFRSSIRQDETRDPALTARMQKMAPLSIYLFAFSLTFAAFDWMMSLEPTWFSTIYGVYVFAGAAVAIHALVTILTLGLKSRGLLGEAVNVEHYHDLGKMTFGLIVFHAYIGFGQMMLQWYANIPEEIAYYQVRWHGEGWKGVSYFLIFGHFGLPFLFLISRVIKRKLPLLAFGCMWMLVIHVVDLYWFVMPAATPGLAPHWLDVSCLLAVGGVYFAVVLYGLRRHALIPLGDPRLERSLRHVNV